MNRMPRGIVLTPGVETEQSFEFVFDGRPWVAVTLALAAGLFRLAQANPFALEPSILWVMQILAVVMLAGCVRNLGSRLTVRVDKRLGAVTCRGTWSWIEVRWARAAADFQELRLIPASEGGRLANGHLELVAKAGGPLLLSATAFWKPDRHPKALALAKRLGDVLHVPVRDL
jgi:hypothetical protein